MHTITLWRWHITDDRGRRIETRHRMTEADALATDPTAERIPGTEDVRRVHPLGEYPGHHRAGDKPGPTSAG